MKTKVVSRAGNLPFPLTHILPLFLSNSISGHLDGCWSSKALGLLHLRIFVQTVASTQNPLPLNLHVVPSKT